MSSEPAVRLDNLSKVYRIYADPAERLKEIVLPSERPKHEFWALNDVSFNVARGETVGIIGGNGAGKSTLLQIVAGALTPTKGQVAVNGRIAPMIELGASFNPEFNGRENVTLAADVMGVSGATLRARLDDILEFAELGSFIDEPLKTYSSGMYARLAFAVFANLDADVMIIDEILSVGDAVFNQKCMRRIREFKERGAILMTSHDTSALVNLCDRVIWLERGMVRDVGAPQEICRDYLAAMNAAASGGRDFRIGGQRKKPPPARPHAGTSHPAPEGADPWAFDASTPRATPRNARITSIALSAAGGSENHQWQGGDEAALVIGFEVARAEAPLALVFDIRDRLGQILLSERTIIAQAAHGAFTARFVFELPEFRPEEYVISATLLARDAGGGIVKQDETIDAAVFSIFRSLGFGMAGVATPVVRLERLHAR